MTSLAAIILTKNESMHIARCISSIRDICSEIYVIDSYSTDNTIEICQALGVTVLRNTWINYSTQFNWALDNCPIKSDWCLRIDADEYLTDKLRDSIKSFLSSKNSSNYFGASIKRSFVFLGKHIKWGGVRSIPMVRLFRSNHGRCEDRWMDEHIVIDGQIYTGIVGELIDHNLNDLSWWTAKHNSYATREAIDRTLNSIAIKKNAPSITNSRRKADINFSAKTKRLLKDRFYNHLPSGAGPLMYFLYRYIFLLGFLDGKIGFSFHFLQGLWYRYLVELKTSEIKDLADSRGITLPQAIFEIHKVSIKEKE